MSALTRRRDPEARQQAWLIYFGDVHVGTISMGAGGPLHADQWSWRCGFYPGSRPGECTAGRATSFETARKAFEAAWRFSLTNRTADFQAWREHRASTAEKYRRFDRGERMPIN